MILLSINNKKRVFLTKQGYSCHLPSWKLISCAYTLRVDDFKEINIIWNLISQFARVNRNRHAPIKWYALLKICLREKGAFSVIAVHIYHFSQLRSFVLAGCIIWGSEQHRCSAIRSVFHPAVYTLRPFAYCSLRLLQIEGIANSSDKPLFALMWTF